MNFSDLDDFRIRADVFSVGAVEEKFRDMTVKFNRKEYGEAVAMAKTLIESYMCLCVSRCHVDRNC